MSKTIYYFTSTGNSLQAALDIVDGLGGADVVSMTNAGMNTSCDSDVVGFVFPSFCWGMPHVCEALSERRREGTAALCFRSGSSMAHTGNRLGCNACNK